jgi:uracil-DNA glycosylase
MASDTLARLEQEIPGCQACPRLRRHCLEVARVRRAAYRGQTYWGLPVPGFGDAAARILLVGLAPGAHGANRTGRLFTGDRSGDFLFAALYRTGLANQPESRERHDGLRLSGVFVSAVGRCAPPENRPSREEIQRCLPYLVREMRLLPQLRVLVPLGGIAYAGIFETWELMGLPVPAPRPKFGHGVFVPGGDGRPGLLASYHPSQQNTQTGRLTPGMLDTVLRRARKEAGLGRPRAAGEQGSSAPG